MKAIAFLILLLPTISVGQGTLNLSEMNLLWTNYPNKIELATGQYKKKVRIVGENMKLTPTDKNKYTAIVTPTDKDAKIHILSKKWKRHIENLFI